MPGDVIAMSGHTAACMCVNQLKPTRIMFCSTSLISGVTLSVKSMISPQEGLGDGTMLCGDKPPWDFSLVHTLCYLCC